ncbi:helix-turn-helix domain-containing protein [Nonomuraea sp. NPDC046802]|uniref:ArsR/SmtB family transcription factor n=1 Tax=Nonomuraea sp. NPDC046802 TaxID=3154919 RepID=UPI0033CC1E74
MITGTLRIRFTADDLARVRIAPGPDPLWEMMMSLFRLREQGGGSVANWRRKARRDLAAAGLLTRVRTELMPLAASGAYFPDFLTPLQAQNGLEAGTSMLADTPPIRVRREMDVLRAHTALPAGLDDLARGEVRAIRRLSRLVDAYCRTTFSAHRPHIQTAVGHARAGLVRQLSMHGVDDMLARLAPVLLWRPPVLTARYPAGDREIELRGRGLTLIPSYFCQGTPVALADDGLPPVLVYPVSRRSLPAPDDGPLADLLGATRAAVLSTIALYPGCTTSELARRTPVSLSGASKHAQVLHRSGFITSTRQANLVIHELTALGAAVLHHHQPDGP